MPATLRSAIIEYVQERLQAIDKVVGDVRTFKFDVVGIGPLTTTAMRQHFSAGIVVGRETKADLNGTIVEPTLPLAIEFRVNVQNSDVAAAGDAALVAEYVLGGIQLAMGADPTLGGAVIDTKEIANELDSETYGDKSVVGVIFYQVKYRHNRHNPTQYGSG